MRENNSNPIRFSDRFRFVVGARHLCSSLCSTYFRECLRTAPYTVFLVWLCNHLVLAHSAAEASVLVHRGLVAQHSNDQGPSGGRTTSLAACRARHTQQRIPSVVGALRPRVAASCAPCQDRQHLQLCQTALPASANSSLRQEQPTPSTPRRRRVLAGRA